MAANTAPSNPVIPVAHLVDHTGPEFSRSFLGQDSDVELGRSKDLRPKSEGHL